MLSDLDIVQLYTKEEFQHSFVSVLLDTLKTFISFGATPETKVGKLKKFREPSILNQLLPPAAIVPPQNNFVANVSGKLQWIAMKNMPKKKEKRVPEKEKEYCEDGLCTAWHFISEYPIMEVIHYIETLKIPMVEGNWLGDTALMKIISANSGDPFITFEEIYGILKGRIDIDKPNSKGITPFLAAMRNNNYRIANIFASDGANVNANDADFNFALKYAVNSNNVAQTKELLEKFKANPNKKDDKMRTVLHIAINNSSPKIDSTSEIETLLLECGCDVNSRDSRGKSALHYAFIKIGNFTDNSVIDPIETVTTLCSKKQIDVNIQDDWGKTPLHYAAQRSSTICSVFLLNRGAKIEMKDIYGNTPLAIAFLNNHPDYSITLIERNADCTQMVYPEIIKEEKGKKSKKIQPQKVEKMLNEEGDESEEIEDDNEFKDEEVEEEESEDDKEENNIQNSASIFGNTNIFGQPNMFGQQNMFGQTNNPAPQKIARANTTVTDSPQSMFRIGIRMGWQGLLYLLLDKNYDYMRGMEDALTEAKFQLLLNLLRKTANDAVVQRTNDKKQNLLHILAMHGKRASYHELQEIYLQFVKRGVPHMAIDTLGRSALHYAIISRNDLLAKVLLNSKYDPNLLDKEGYNAVILLVKGNLITTCTDIIKDVHLAGGNLNVMYKELFEENPIENTKDEEMKEDDYFTTPLIHLIRHVITRPNLVKECESFIIWMLEKGADASIVDSKGNDIFIYIAKENSISLMALVLKYAKKYSKKTVNKIGRTAMHYVVKQYEIGSYQNTDLLDMLLNNSFDYNIKDENGFTCLDYATLQKNGRMAAIFKKHGIALPDNKPMQIDCSFKKIEDWPLEVDYSHDAEAYIKKVEELAAKEIKKEEFPVDSIGTQNEALEVVLDNQGEPYDTYMSKVDLKNGMWGEYLFYRMQLLREKNRDVFLVYTRWGRIGDTGMFQKTPLGSKEEAITEFEKIFKSKSGNEWTERKNFVKQKHKYVIMKTKREKIHYKTLLRPFDYKAITNKSKLPKQIRKLLKLIVDISLYEKSMVEYGIDTEILPVTKLEKQTLLECKSLLEKLSSLSEQLDAERTKGTKANFVKIEEMYNDINDTSSEYYELLPQASYRTNKPPPLDNIGSIKQHFTLIDDLINIEAASKILLATQSKIQEIHPLDYCYKSLGIELELLQDKSEEKDLLLKYISKSTHENFGYYYGNSKIKFIYKIQRRGEAERFKPYESKPNRWLLFHGSKTSNFIGILSQGLRVAPPYTALTGSAFGNGIYFADIFSKSAGYCSTYNNGSSLNDKLMLICEVALGKIYHSKGSEFAVDLKREKCDSHQVLGQKGPDKDCKFYFEDGSEMPIGDIIPTPQTGLSNFLGYNEYVISNPEQVKMKYLIQWA